MEIVGQVFVLAGALVFATAGLGVLKLPDAYTRVSAVSTAAGFGLGQILIGVLLITPGLESAVKVAVAVVLQLLTSAIGGMAIARSGYLTGSPLSATTAPDQIAEDTPSSSSRRDAT